MSRRSRRDHSPGSSYWKELGRADAALYRRTIQRSGSQHSGDRMLGPSLAWRVGSTELQWAGTPRLFGRLALGSSKLVVFQTDKLVLRETTRTAKVQLLDYIMRPRTPRVSIYDQLAYVAVSPEGKLDISLGGYDEVKKKIGEYEEQGLAVEPLPEDYNMLLHYLRQGAVDDGN